MRGLLVLALAVAASGCLSPINYSEGPPKHIVPPTQSVSFHEDGCSGYLLGMFIPPTRTDASLPPGFHWREGAEFIPPDQPGTVVPYRTPATGLALAIAVSFVCPPRQDEPPHKETLVGVLVRAPAVDGERRNATYDLYEVEHYAETPAIRQRLGQWGWPVHNATLNDRRVVPQVREHSFSLQVGTPEVTAPVGPGHVTFDAMGKLAYGGVTPEQAPDAPVRAYGNVSTLRFWHQTPRGIGSLDYTFALVFELGEAACYIQPDTELYNLTRTQSCDVPVRDPTPAVLSCVPPQCVPTVPPAYAEQVAQGRPALAFIASFQQRGLDGLAVWHPEGAAQ